jgi:hypothetical protein
MHYSYKNFRNKTLLILLGLLMATGSCLAEQICNFNGGINYFTLPYKNVTISYTPHNCGIAIYDTQLYVNGMFIGTQCSGGSAFIADASKGVRFQAQKTNVLKDTFYGWWVSPASTVGIANKQCTLLYEDGGLFPNWEGEITLNGTRIPPTLAVTKSASAPVLVAGASGQSYTIRIDVTNWPTTADITLADTLPAGVTTSGAITIASPNAGLLSGCPAAGATSLAGCTITAGAGTPIVLTVPVNVAASTANPVGNTATATGGGDTTCPAGANCTSTSSTPVISAVNDTDTKPPGLASSTNVATNDKFPPNATFTVTGGSCSTASPLSPATNTTGLLAYTLPLASSSCTVQYKVCAPAPNGTVCGSATLTVTPVAATIAINKTASTDPLTAGSSGFFTINIAVSGGSTTTPITLTDALPTGLSLSATPSLLAGSTTSAGASLGCTSGAGATTASCTIASGAGVGNIAIRVPVNLGANTASRITNLASVSGGTTNCTGTPCQGSVSVNVTPAAKAKLTLGKITTVGTGSFSFYGMEPNANGFGNDQISTSTAGQTASGSTVTLAANGATTQVQEVAPAGWVISSAVCTDRNGAVSGNGSAQFGTLDGATLTIDATNVRAGADILCTFTNSQALPTLGFTQSVRVFAPAVFNPPVHFSYAGNNGWVTQPLDSTALFPTKLTGARQTLAATNTATNISITLPTEGGWSVARVSCSDTNAAVSGNNPGILLTTTSRNFTLPANLLKPNAVLLCDVTGLRS